MSSLSDRDAEFREEMRESLREIRKDIRSLIGFRAWLLGASAAVSAIVGLILHIFFK